MQLSRFKCHCLAVGLLLNLPVNALAGDIALTFDDAPSGNSSLMSAAERAQAIISALNNGSVSDVMFFCNTEKLTSSGRVHLRRYTEAGFHLGNHSHSHLSANKIGTSAYIRDVELAHQKLKDMDGFLPYHRFPYLHYGNTETGINLLQAELGKLGYKNGYVTVDNFDFYLNHLLNESNKNHVKVDMKALEQLYIETLWQAIQFYDQLAIKYLKRSPKHVLLLHENDTAALFLPALIQKIRSEGWNIISPQEAYRDPIAETFPKTTFSKQGRVAALAKDAGASDTELRHSRENEAVLGELFYSRARSSGDEQ